MKSITLQEHELFQLVMMLTLLFLFLSLIIVAVMLAYGKRRQNHLLELQDLAYKNKQALYSSQIEIQEQTLRNISQELHDNISQKLGLAKLQLNQLQTMQPGVAIDPTKTVITEAIADIRALSKSLHPDRIATIPLKESIEHEINLLRNVSDAAFICTLEEDPEVLTADQRIILFRIFQELLNNTLKYANATRVDISFLSNDGIILTVADNGAGLPLDYQKGIGHTSIQNRVTLLNGSFHLESIPGKGTVGKVVIPSV